MKRTKERKTTRNLTALKLAVLALAALAVVVFVKYDYSFYDQTIATVTAVEERETETKTGFDGTYEYEEAYLTQELTLTVRNGQYKGETLSSENSCTASGVYDTRYEKGDDVFVENLEEGPAADGGFLLTGSVTGLKRDYFVALVLALLFALFLAVGGREGALTILSLILNMLCFYWVLTLYLKGVNLLLMTVPMALFFTAMLLFFMHGFNRKSLIALAATFCSVAVTTLIAWLVLRAGGSVDYEFMDYLIQPYEQRDADLIFLSEILIGSLGASMDIVVTITMTVDQITAHNPRITAKELFQSCRTVGDDLVGTMISIMFFSNVAAAVPFIILSMRNGIAFATILRYHSFFEIARFLTGSIGIVLSIPAAAGIAVWYYTRKTHRKEADPC